MLMEVLCNNRHIFYVFIVETIVGEPLVNNLRVVVNMCLLNQVLRRVGINDHSRATGGGDWIGGVHMLNQEASRLLKLVANYGDLLIHEWLTTRGYGLIHEVTVTSFLLLLLGKSYSSLLLQILKIK